MKRIKIRCDDPRCKDAKVLRFQESIELDVLILNIAIKLGVEVNPDHSTQDQWELRLNGLLVRNSDQIDYDDHILLTRKRTDNSSRLSYDMGVVEVDVHSDINNDN